MNDLSGILRKPELPIESHEHEMKRYELKNVCRDFESYLVGFIFKRSIQPMFVRETPFMGKHERWFRDMLVDEIAASGGTAGIGLAEYLYRELVHSLDRKKP